MDKGKGKGVYMLEDQIIMINELIEEKTCKYV